MILNLFTYTFSLGGVYFSFVSVFHSGWLRTDESGKSRVGGRLDYCTKRSALRDEEPQESSGEWAQPGACGVWSSMAWICVVLGQFSTPGHTSWNPQDLGTLRVFYSHTTLPQLPGTYYLN